MKPARNVHVFHIHEEAFVKESLTLQGTDTQEHEASRKTGRIDDPVIAESGQRIPVVVCTENALLREEAAEDQVSRRRQEFAQSLHFSLSVYDFRQHIHCRHTPNLQIDNLL